MKREQHFQIKKKVFDDSKADPKGETKHLYASSCLRCCCSVLRQTFSHAAAASVSGFPDVYLTQTLVFCDAHAWFSST